MDVLSDVRVALTILLGLPFGFWLQWKKSRETSWLLISRKREAVRALFKDGAWRKAAPLDFHFAMQDAFGRSVEPCELKFIESRQDPARLLMNRISAGASHRFLPSEQRYIDARKGPRCSFAVVSAFFVVVASMALPLFGIGAFLAWKMNSYFYTFMALLYAASTFIASVHLSLTADAAKYVLSGERHEPAVPLDGDDPTPAIAQRLGLPDCILKA